MTPPKICHNLPDDYMVTDPIYNCGECDPCRERASRANRPVEGPLGGFPDGQGSSVRDVAPEPSNPQDLSKPYRDTYPYPPEKRGFDPDELVRWAETYGHPEEWAKKVQALHKRVEELEEFIRSMIRGQFEDQGDGTVKFVARNA